MLTVWLPLRLNVNWVEMYLKMETTMPVKDFTCRNVSQNGNNNASWGPYLLQTSTNNKNRLIYRNTLIHNSTIHYGILISCFQCGVCHTVSFDRTELSCEWAYCCIHMYLYLETITRTHPLITFLEHFL